MSEKHKDEITGVETTGHSWDGIRELNNPLPKWWLYTFYASIIWSIAYWVVMPAWPVIWNGQWTYTEGVIGYTNRNSVADELAAVAEGRSEVMREIAQTPLTELAQDPKLSEVALALCATSAKTDQAAIARILTEHGRGEFLDAWLRHRGVDWAADLIPDLSNLIPQAEKESRP